MIIEEAFKDLAQEEDLVEATYVIRDGKKVQKDYRGGFDHGFEDLFDQVYCTLTHGGDKGFDRQILGDLGKYEIKYDDDCVGVDYSSDEVAKIVVTDYTDRIQNAISIAQIYNLEYDIRDAGDVTRVIIKVPFDEPVDRSVFHYVDAEEKLQNLASSTRGDAAVNEEVAEDSTTSEQSASMSDNIEDAAAPLSENTITNSLPVKVDRWLMDLAQQFGQFSYTDISNFGKVFTKDQMRELTKLKAEYEEEAQYDSEETEAILNDIVSKVTTMLLDAHIDSSEHSNLIEDVNSSMPATPLASQEIYDFVDALPEATGTRPPQAFKLGYIRELKAEIASKFRGGRGSEDNPFVRIFKATEYSRLYTKAAYENLGSTKAYRQETGKEAGHERTGFHSTDIEQGNILNAIGTYPNGDAALQAYPMSDNKVKVAYFISINNDDLVPATRDDVAEYLTPAAAAKLTGTRIDDMEMARSANNINRFKLSGIYMIGNLGHSIIR